MPRPITVHAFAKINLELRVGTAQAVEALYFRVFDFFFALVLGQAMKNGFDLPGFVALFGEDGFIHFGERVGKRVDSKIIGRVWIDDVSLIQR